MKKFLLFIALVLSVGIYAAAEIRKNMDAIVITENNAAEDYVKVASRVQCLVIPKGEGNVSTSFCDVYKKKNMSGAYYLEWYWNFYIPVYRNESSTYKGVNVSSYKYCAETKNDKYFFTF